MKTPKQKTMAKHKDERPAKIVGPNYEETTIAQKTKCSQRQRWKKNGLNEQQKTATIRW